MQEHMSLRERVAAVSAYSEPVFEKSADSKLAAFGELFVDSELLTFDANKHLRTGALTPIYDCWTESLSGADAEPETFVATWTPVWEHDDPLTGFRTGRDSDAFGSTPTVAMPQDERTAALLLLVTSAFVHLSASRDGSALLIQGAMEDTDTYRFLTLDAVPANATDAATRQRWRGARR